MLPRKIKIGCAQLQLAIQRSTESERMFESSDWLFMAQSAVRQIPNFACVANDRFGMAAT